MTPLAEKSAQPLRVLIASDFYPPFIGGLERQSAMEARELAARGHTIQDWADWTWLAGSVEAILTDPESGLPVRRSLYGATEQEVRAKLIRALSDMQRGALPFNRGRGLTLTRYTERWLARDRVRPKTGRRSTRAGG